MMNLLRRAVTTAVVAPVLLLGACDDSSTAPSAPDGPPTFSILLTDAPGDFNVAMVTIDKIYLQGDAEEGRVVLMDEPVTTNLLDLQGEVLELVKEKVVPEGTYSELRMVISGGYIAVDQGDGPDKIYASSPEYAEVNGVTADGRLQMPSFAQSGLKIKLPGGSVDVEGKQHVILLDFNVAESFGHVAGNSGKWVMHPVIHAEEFGLTGGIDIELALAEGLTLPAGFDLTNVRATVDGGGDKTSAFSDQDEDGVFTTTIQFLSPETYTVTLLADGALVSADPVEVAVTSGAMSDAVITLTGAQLTGPIYGTITAPADVAVEGLTVTATRTDTAADPITATVAADGTYYFSALAPGTYTVSIAAPEGYTAAPVEDVVVEEGSAVRVDLEITAGT